MSRRPAALAILLLGAAGLSACGSGGGDAKPKPKLRVVATTAQVADFVRAVGGSRIEVDQLVPNRRDPHEYDPGPQQLEKVLKDVDLVVRSGGDLDAWLPGAAKQAGVDDIDVVDLSKAVVLREQGGRVDFRWWQDPRNIAAAALKIRDELIKRDADGSRPYRGAASRYRRKLARLDRSAAHCLATVIPADRRLFTVHDAFGYLAARYRLKVAGALLRGRYGPASDFTFDAARVAEEIRRSGAPAVFGEHGVAFDDVLSKAADRAGVSVAGALYGDTLGSRDTTEGRFTGAFAHNVETIASGLGAPRCHVGD